MNQDHPQKRRSSVIILRGSLILSGAVGLFACSAQAGTTYQGEALATLHGAVQLADASQSPPPLEAALVWERFQEVNDDAEVVAHNSLEAIATAVSVSSTFPSDFTLQIFALPPDNVLIPCSGNFDAGRGPRFAVAGIYALRQSTDVTNVLGSDEFGVSPNYYVVYADADISTASCGTGLSLIPAKSLISKGYHRKRPA